MSKRNLLIIIMVCAFLSLTGCQLSNTSSSSPLPGSPVANTTPPVQIQDFVTNLNVPWEIAFAPDGRIFLSERSGKIMIIQNGQLQSDPWMTIDVAAVGEGGLLGLTLGFKKNSYEH